MKVAPRISSTPMTPRSHIRLWAALVKADRPVTVGELSDQVGVNFQVADFRMNLWVDAGLIERIGRRPFQYQFTPETEKSPLPPIIDKAGRARARRPTSYQKIWHAIRVLKTFDIPMLRMVSGTGEHTTRGYIGMLQRVGYVRMECFGSPIRQIPSRYTLVRNTGRTPPRPTIRLIDGREMRELVDENTGERHDVSTGTPSKRRQYNTEKQAERGEG